MTTECPLGGFEGNARPDNYYGEVLPNLYKKSGDPVGRAEVAEWLAAYARDILPSLVIDRDAVRARHDEKGHGQ